MADSNITLRGGGGGGLHFRDPVDVFADLAARTAAFGPGGSVEGEHTQFAADRSLAIVIGTLANPTAFQTYTGSDGAYDDATWLNRTDAVQGRPGTDGDAGHSPVFSSGDAFPTAPAPAANDFHLFISDVASGLAWKAADGTTDLTAADAGDIARYDGTDWVRQGNLGGAAGASDGVLDDAPFDASTYMAALSLTVGGPVVLDLSAILATIGALTARVDLLENPPPPHTGRRYAALRADGATAADFTAADFTAAGATNSDTQDIDSPSRNTNMVVGLAVPVSEGELTGIAELDANGNLNPLASMIRVIWNPQVGGTAVTLDIGGAQHYVYASVSVIFASQLGVIGWRLTQTP